ncbi:OB-fold domain-containing protein [Rhodococcoides fascians]|uniref:OB-fold domain-containing protein n=1 Tax=Rhodococcoides fascians TaxID=1828 RepID=UPI00069176E8|nr:OB-fold domain-containing protein [Rhodococcus fascians]
MSDLDGAGTVYAATAIRSGRKDRPLPYGLAYVDLDAGLRVMASFEVDGDALAPETRVSVSEVARSDVGLPILNAVPLSFGTTP